MHLTEQDLNIALTAVGLLWNLSDYFYQNQASLKDSIIAEPKILPDLPGYKEMSVFDKLWMCLFSRLGDLCLDPRPATRSQNSSIMESLTNFLYVGKAPVKPSSRP